MKLSLFDYHLPPGLIAQSPTKPRDHSRLLVYNRSTKKIKHDYFYNLGNYLQPGDVLIFNNTRVFPARLQGRKTTVHRPFGKFRAALSNIEGRQAPIGPEPQGRRQGAFGGGKLEVFLLKSVQGKTWEVLIGGRVRHVGQVIKFSQGLQCEAVKKLDQSVWQVKFNKAGSELLKIVDKIGTTPTPPYIKKKARLSDYQTVYAKKTGSVAGPTAGFHFTKSLLAKLKKQGIQIEYITLHVGLGTFQPVKVDNIKEHKMHAEFAEVDSGTARRLIKAKKQGQRIIAVGTTSVRTLEYVYGLQSTDYGKREIVHSSKVQGQGFKSWINPFIYPGYKFKLVDAMITNFHLPKSTLLMLISAFIGRKRILDIYKKAIKKKYRFYSFGDGMLIL